MIPNYDSILVAQDSNIINTSEFFAVGKGLPDRSVAMESIPYSAATDDFVSYVFVAMFIALSLILYNSKEMIAFRFRNFFTTKRVYSIENVNDNQREVFRILVATTVGAFSLGVILYHCLSLHITFPSYLEKPHWVLGISGGLFLLLLYVRALVYTLVNWVFFDNESQHRWNVGYFLLVSLTSYAFYVLAVAAVYLHLHVVTVTICLCFVVLLYEMLHIYKLFANFKFKSYGVLLIFLYFCTVEMLPMMLLWRLIDWVFNSSFVNNLLT